MVFHFMVTGKQKLSNWVVKTAKSPISATGKILKYISYVAYYIT